MTNDQLKVSAQQILETNILPYWLALRDPVWGGFYGRIDGHNTLHPDAPRGAVLNARILWAFSAAYRVLGKIEYLDAAKEAKRYIETCFIDPDYGGVYWSVTAEGKPLDTHKQFYAQAFMLYAFSEYIRATGDTQAMPVADALFRLIEKYGRDREYLGYIEAASRNWQLLSDMRLSDKDENTIKSQNTNLHILEAYTNYFRIRPLSEVRGALSLLIDTFEHYILLSTGHLGLFFDEQWRPTNDHFSAGHDIECSWLLNEAADVLGIDCTPTVLRLAEAAKEGIHPDGSIGEQTWWEQAEAVVGFFNIRQITNDQSPMELALRTYSYIQDVLIDREQGEWFWSVLPDGTPDRTQDKAGFWKCPYHNSRMCLEIMERLKCQ